MQCLRFHMIRGYVLSLVLPHHLEESTNIVVGIAFELCEMLLQYASCHESAGARFDVLICTYCFDFILFPRDVLNGFSPFVW